MARAYKFTLVPENTKKVVEYLVIEDDEYSDDIHGEIESIPDEFFNGLVDDRYPGYVYKSHEEVPVSKAKKHRPFEL